MNPTDPTDTLSPLKKKKILFQHANALLVPVWQIKFNIQIQKKQNIDSQHLQENIQITL